MAVRIRLKRIGRTHRPFYRICVMDSRVHREGKAIEEVGWYDTAVADKSQRVNVKLDRIDYWVSVGASLSDRVANLVKKVRTNKWTSGTAPAPMQAAKVPEAPAAAEETPAAEATEG